MSIHPEDKSCSDLGRVPVLKDPGSGPYRQSERTPIYLQLAKQLVEGGFAYPCFCTDEELEVGPCKLKSMKPMLKAPDCARFSALEIDI
jgi:glutamyl/glutaminyl-tRNA synthetase